MKSYKMQLPVSFYILFYFSFYITRYQFFNFLELHSALSEKFFRCKVSFFNRFTQTPQPLNSQNLPCVTKAFCQFFLKCLRKCSFLKFVDIILQKHLLFIMFFFFKDSCFHTSISNYL